MTKDEAKAELQNATLAVAKAVAILGEHMDLFDAFEREKRMLENVGPVLNPTLFNSSERRAVEALLSPPFAAAANLVRVHREMATRAQTAFEKVNR